MFTLYGYEAEAEGIELRHFEVIPRKNVGLDVHLKKFPLSKGKIPGLTGPGVEITETIAIVTYLAKLSNKSKLFGDGSLEQEATVVSWMSWANQELLPTLALWFLPLIPDFTQPAPYDEKTIEAGKVASLSMLGALESILECRRHLVGNGLTLADIFVAIYVTRGLQWVLAQEWRNMHPAIMRHVEMVINWAPVRSVIPEFIMIKEETPNVDPNQ